MAYWRQPNEWAARIVQVTLDDLARYGIRPLTPVSWAQHGEHLEAYLLPGTTGISVGIRYGDGPAEYLSLHADQQGLRALLTEKEDVSCWIKSIEEVAGSDEPAPADRLLP